MRMRCAESTAASPSTEPAHADRARRGDFHRALCGGRSPGRVDDAGRRSRTPGFGFSQGRRRPADELLAGIGRRRGDARALFDHRPRSGSDLAHQRRWRRDQSRSAVRCRRLRSLRRGAAGLPARAARPPKLPPMAAGMFGYLGYDMVRLMEELPAPRPDPIGIPDAILIRPGLVIVFDTVEDTLAIVTPVRPEPGISAKLALSRAVDRLSAVIDDLDRPLDKEAADGAAEQLHVSATSNTAPQEFEAMVRQAQEKTFSAGIFLGGFSPGS